MELLNKEKNDLSPEGYIYLAIILEMAYALQIMGFRMADAMDKIGAKGHLTQRKKAAFNDAKRHAQGLVNGLDVAFDGTFSKLYDNADGMSRADNIHGQANEIIRLLLIYMTRGDGEPEKRKRMQQALLNFKQDYPHDLAGLLKFHGFKD